jgi:hypothetical protein
LFWTPAVETLHLLGRPREPVVDDTPLTWFASPGTRVDAALEKTTKRPSAESLGAIACWSAASPPLPTLARTVIPVRRSWRNTSWNPLSSPSWRLLARLGTPRTGRPPSRGRAASIVGLLASRSDADALRRPRDEIADVDVGDVIRVLGDERLRARPSDEASVSRDRGEIEGVRALGGIEGPRDLRPNCAREDADEEHRSRTNRSQGNHSTSLACVALNVADAGHPPSTIGSR